MSTTPEQIDLWRSASSENQSLEFKEAKTQIDYDRLCKYCVALANKEAVCWYSVWLISGHGKW
jgi:hypothetical protein